MMSSTIVVPLNTVSTCAAAIISFSIIIIIIIVIENEIKIVTENEFELKSIQTKEVHSRRIECQKWKSQAIQ
jgi:hypothetical protein